MNPINWHSCFFLLAAAVACAAALGVVASKNVVRMAVFLLHALGAVAGLFFLAGADFVGAMQLMIYVGGTLVLIAFGVMLTARRPFLSMDTKLAQWIAGTLVGGCLLAVLLRSALSVDDWAGPVSAAPRAQAEDLATAAPLGMGMLGVRVDRLDEPEAARREGMSGYLLPFEIISVHLLVVLIGAAYLARSTRPGEARLRENVEDKINAG
ncbi:MAG: NADH-quinone oxidoreductase subunit J [Pirellulales bacterium]|nr:NADH-quinone oxidoreductase subunit J [Pirellulales bacterium]